MAGSPHEYWRRKPESNRRTRICNPLHNHSAIAPGASSAKPAIIQELARSCMAPGSGRAAQTEKTVFPPLKALIARSVLACRSDGEVSDHRPVSVASRGTDGLGHLMANGIEHRQVSPQLFRRCVGKSQVFQAQRGLESRLVAIVNDVGRIELIRTTAEQRVQNQVEESLARQTI